MNVEQKIANFKNDLETLAPLQVVRKHITYGSTFLIDESQYYELKDMISEYFDLHPSQVMIVGSGKLGFSIVDKPNKGKPRFRLFSDESDIDVAIVSPILFEKIWKEVFDYHSMKGFWYKKNEFVDYLFQGWIRPDKLPPDKTFKLARDWWDFFRMLSNSDDFGPYQIRAGLYKDWHFLENYHIKAVEQCKNI